MATRRRSWWGWGWEDQALTPRQTDDLAASLQRRFDLALSARPAPRLADVQLRAPRVRAPAALASLCSDTAFDRAGHSYGKSFRDVVRGSYGRFPAPPDLVAFPRDEAAVVALLDWCSAERLAAIPYGGGSSVVGGVESAVDGDFRGVVSIDLTGLDRVLEIDRTSRAARIQAGALGPVLEDQLRPHGYTLRHFPQSFEFSTLGGWLATRSGGHYATVYTHIDDLVESMRVITPVGVSESRRLPGSGAGPSPDRLFLGSEGALGIITEAWMRIQQRPLHKAAAGVRFVDLGVAAEAVRQLGQSGLFPTNCRLLDPVEAAVSAGVTDGTALLLLGFESADHPVDAWMDRAVELCRDAGGTLPDGVSSSGPAIDAGGGGGPADGEQTAAGRQGSVGAWRSSFLRAPYSRDALVRMSVIVETFETATTWDRFADLHHDVTRAVQDAVHRVCGTGFVTCRFTHVYPDGPAPYFSVFAPGRPGSEIDQWDEIKAAASDALIAAGGTITHHHAVGRDHDPWYRRQRPEPVGLALRAAKNALDPAGILNPGVIA
ncbi:MAG: FAD-binding oxidoreductase [Acidimicrobiales bacterium]|jgi:alkyldihydroxyacetonephosphate synthase|nr:FAD-binding oxidoreductase [Acidimicrobiales bacterium]